MVSELVLSSVEGVEPIEGEGGPWRDFVVALEQARWI